MSFNGRSATRAACANQGALWEPAENPSRDQGSDDVPGEHELPDFDDTVERQRTKQRLPRLTTPLSSIPVSLRDAAELWRDGKKRVDDALAPATGIALAVSIAVLLWALIVWIIERMTFVTATG